MKRERKHSRACRIFQSWESDISKSRAGYFKVSVQALAPEAVGSKTLKVFGKGLEVGTRVEQVNKSAILTIRQEVIDRPHSRNGIDYTKS